MYETVTIRILGQEYRVKAGPDEDHIRSLSQYINEKVSEIQTKGKAVTTSELVAMTMLHMADDLHKASGDLRAFRDAVALRVSRMIERIDKAMA